MAALGMAPGHAPADAGRAPALAMAGRAVVLGEGGGGPGWARALVRAGCETTLVVPDADDARRLADLMRQAAARGDAQPAVASDPGAALGAELLVLPDADAAGHLSAPVLAGLAPGAVVIAAGDRLLLRALARVLPMSLPLIGMHLPPPASASGIVEIMPASPGRGGAGEPALARARALARGLGRLAVTLPPGVDSPALAMLGRLTECADAMLMSGATPWDLDAAMAAGGWAQGLFLREDQAGIDHMVALRRAHAAVAGRAVAPIAPRMLAEGRLGVKGGVGWYRYPGGGGPVVDPLMEDMCTEEAHFARWPRAVPCAAEMQARLALAVVDAAAGLAGRVAPGVLDLVAVRGLGFPAGSGGPLTLAARLGAALAAPLGVLEREAPGIWAGAGARVAQALRQAANGSDG